MFEPIIKTRGSRDSCPSAHRAIEMCFERDESVQCSVIYGKYFLGRGLSRHAISDTVSYVPIL